MTSVHLNQVLVYYDGPQVLEARDSIGGHYIGIAIRDAKYEFLMVGVSPERLRQFRGGSIDLLALISERPSDVGWQLAKLADEKSNEIELSEISYDVIATRFLPEPGYVLRKPLSDSDLVKSARERNGLVMEVTLDPPEAVDHQINSSTLGQFLLVFQRMLKYAFFDWVREHPNSQKIESDYSVAVSGLKAGSVKIELQPQQTANLFGTSDVAPAVETVLEIMRRADRPDRLLLEVSAFRGHLASSFLSLLDILVEYNTRLQIDWADGLTDSVHSAYISQDVARAARTELSLITELIGVRRVVTGVLKKADVNRGTWRLESKTEVVSGKTADDGPSLSHLELDRQYQFHCTEYIELSPTGREKVTVFLNEIL